MKILFAILFSFGILCYSYAQNDVFVSTTGSDATGNGSIANPFATAEAAVNSNLLTPGSNLYFRAGTYYNPNYRNGDIWKIEKTVFINNIDGTPSAYINIKPYNNEKVIIRGDGDMIFQIRSSSYVLISGFEIIGETENITYADALDHQFEFKRTSLANPVELRVPRYTNTDQSGLENLSSYTIYRPTLYNGHGLVVQNSDHVEVLNNLVHHVPGEGMRFSGSDYLKFVGNEIHNCGRRSSTGVHGISGYNQKSIDLNDGVKTIIAQNLVHDNYQEIFSWTENKTIITAEIDEGKGITLQRINGSNTWLHGRILIENNITYRNGFSGVHVNDGIRVDIINNTSYMDCRSGRGNQLGISVQTGDDVKIYNNLVFTDLSWNGYSIGGSALTNIVMSKNMINGGLDPDYVGIATSTSVVSDIKLVDTAARNFHLQSTSPAINIAVAAVAPTDDYYTILRDAQPDLGAVEYFSTLPLQLISFTANKKDKNILLNWLITNAENVSHFEIERSANGIVWKKTGLVKFENGKNNYQFADEFPLVSDNYYRLKTIDENAQFSYSSAVKVQFKKSRIMSAYPNPASNILYVNGIDKNAPFKIISLSGGDVTNSVKIEVSASQFKLYLTNLFPGNYILSSGSQSIIITKTK